MAAHANLAKFVVEVEVRVTCHTAQNQEELQQKSVDVGKYHGKPAIVTSCVILITGSNASILYAQTLQHLRHIDANVGWPGSACVTNTVTMEFAYTPPAQCRRK